MLDRHVFRPCKQTIRDDQGLERAIPRRGNGVSLFRSDCKGIVRTGLSNSARLKASVASREEGDARTNRIRIYGTYRALRVEALQSSVLLTSETLLRLSTWEVGRTLWREGRDVSYVRYLRYLLAGSCTVDARRHQ